MNLHFALLGFLIHFYSPTHSSWFLFHPVESCLVQIQSSAYVHSGKMVLGKQIADDLNSPRNFSLSNSLCIHSSSVSLRMFAMYLGFSFLLQCGLLLAVTFYILSRSEFPSGVKRVRNFGVGKDSGIYLV